MRTPIGQTLTALVSTHFDEVFRRNQPQPQKVAKRFGIESGLRCWCTTCSRGAGRNRRSLPPRAAVPGFSKYFDRLLEALARFGSAQLQRDVTHYGALVAGIPGLSIQQLDNPR